MGCDLDVQVLQQAVPAEAVLAGLQHKASGAWDSLHANGTVEWRLEQQAATCLTWTRWCMHDSMGPVIGCTSVALVAS